MVPAPWNEVGSAIGFWGVPAQSANQAGLQHKLDDAALSIADWTYWSVNYHHPNRRRPNRGTPAPATPTAAFRQPRIAERRPLQIVGFPC
jgi:hypothetical protein